MARVSVGRASEHTGKQLGCAGLIEREPCERRSSEHGLREHGPSELEPSERGPSERGPSERGPQQAHTGSGADGGGSVSSVNVTFFSIHDFQPRPLARPGQAQLTDWNTTTTPEPLLYC